MPSARGGPVRADELIEQLNNDPEYRARVAKADMEQRERREALRRAERPVVDELRGAGIHVKSVWYLSELPERGENAYPILLKPVAHQPATLAVANDGTNPGVSMVLRAFCYHLNAGEDVNITTPANCPGGGGGDFVRGTVVQLDADVHPGDHFHGWGPVDGKDGQTAFVAMTADRTVTVDVGHASTAQKIAAGFSSVAQRIVGLGATIVTGLIMAEAAAFALSSLAIKAATALAKVFGASDSVIVFMEAIGTEIDAEIGVFTSMATCTSSWAAGGSGTLVPGGAPGGAIKAGDWAAMKKTNMMLVSKGTSQGNADLITGAVNPVDWVNAFGSHADNYLADPAQAWGDIGSIGTCMKDRVADYQVTLGLGPAG